VRSGASQLRSAYVCEEGKPSPGLDPIHCGASLNLWEVAVDLASMEHPYENNRILLDDQSNPIVAQPDSVVCAATQLLEVRNV